MMLTIPKIETRKHGKGEEESGITIEKITFWFSEVLQAIEK